MSLYQFPLDLTFRIATLSNDFVVADASGNVLAYVRQKMLKLVEEVQVFSDETRSQLLYTINANKWLDFSASYAFTNAVGMPVGRVARKGWASLWRANYEIYDGQDANVLYVHEENPWAKVFDAIMSDIPGLGLLTGYFFHPTYSVTRQDGTVVARLSKVNSFFGRRFSVTKLSEFARDEEERMILGLMMMILLERRRG